MMHPSQRSSRLSEEARSTIARRGHVPRERVARWLLGAYKGILSPLLHAHALTHCKYLPTCSEYAYAAVVRHGWARGTLLAVQRLARCHPWAEGGADPVPEVMQGEPATSHQRLP